MDAKFNQYDNYLTRNALFYYLLSFGIPFLIMLIAIMVMDVTPFGDHSLAISDGKFYLNGLLSHARMLKGEEGILFSFTSLGGNRIPGLAWGNFNPVKLLSLFATIDNVPVWFTWISLVNMSVCGFTMYIMLSGLYGHKSSHVLFSTSYALMGFNVVNCFQMLFFIGPQVLPLMVLGLIQLLKGKSPLLYILSLFFCIVCNFYFGLILCIASLVVFVTYNYVYSEVIFGRRTNLLTTYIISSVIAGLMASFFWLPALKALSGGGRLNQTSTAEYQFSENMPFIQIFSKLFTGANSVYEEIDGLPNIFCGILVVALVILFFMNKYISKRLKRGTATVLILYLLTFYIKAFTLVMHGFTHTNWFPYRYSFVFTFFLICIAVEQFRHLDKLSIKEVKRCSVVLLLAALVIFSVKYEFISGGEVLLDFALLALIGILFYKWKTKPEKIKKGARIIALLLLVSVNLFANYVISIQKLQNVEGWELDLQNYRDNTLRSGVLIDGVKNYDQSFYRMEKGFSESSYVGADPALYDYNGVSGSGPTIRFFIHQQLNKLGINWFGMNHWYSDGVTAAADTLLGLKYLITSKDLGEEKGYIQRINIGECYIFENPYALSVTFLVDDKCVDIVLGNDAFENLNQIWKSMTSGNQDIFTEEQDITFTLHNSTEGRSITSNEISTSMSKTESNSGTSESNSLLTEYEQEEPTSSYIECRFTAQKDGPIYFFDQAVPMSANGRQVPCVECLGVFEEGDEVVHNFTIGEDIVRWKMMEYCSTLTFAYADNSALREYAEMINSKETSVEIETERIVKGTFTADKRQRILFTIPWDEGWTCYIDGQKVPINKTWDLFMSVEVPEGQHTYEMRFFPAWMNYGIIISIANAGCLVAYMLIWKKKQKFASCIDRESEIADDADEIIDHISDISSAIAETHKYQNMNL